MLMVSKNLRLNKGGRLGVMVVDEICETAETQTTYMTDELKWELKKNQVVFM